MPSPFGHALAGIAVALAGDRRPVGGVWRFLSRPMTLCSVALATLPDADLLFRNFHRTMTHSLGATILVIIVAMAVTGWVTRARSGSAGRAPHRRAAETAKTKISIGWGVVCLLAAAHASHLLTDWLGTDLSIPAGIQLFWPFSDRWFISPWHLFLQLDRRHIFSLPTITLNLRALLWELVVLGPIVGALWWFRDRTRPTPATRSPQKTG